MTDDCRIAIFDRPHDPHQLRDLLVRELALHPTDAMHHAQAAPGILPDRLSREQATRLATAVTQLGARSVVMRAEEVFQFPRHDAVHHARCLDDGLEILEIHGAEEVFVPWAKIALISVGDVPEGETRHWLPEPVTFAAPHHGHDAVTTSVPVGPKVWVVARDPWQAFRIDHRQMNYEYLGPRMSLSATHNFRLLIEDLVRNSPQARQTPGTAAFLHHGSPQELRFASEDDLRRATELHLLNLMQPDTAP